MMELMNDEVRAALPPLYTSEDKSLEETMATVKYFTPWANWTWYAVEFDGQDTFFGLVNGFEMELGNFSLSELSGVVGPMGMMIERDLYWEPRSLAEIKASALTL
jgi:hypothetical protein